MKAPHLLLTAFSFGLTCASLAQEPPSLPDSLWVERRDMRTGEVERFSLDRFPRAETSGGKLTDAFSPDGFDTHPLSTEGDRGFGSLLPINTNTTYPYSAIAKLWISLSNFGAIACTGVMVGNRWVATAGNCLTDPLLGSIVDFPVPYVEPGYDFGTAPYGSVAILNTWSAVGWMNGFDYNYDVGLLELALPVGVQTGWFGIGYETQNSWYTGTFPQKHNIGYPSTDQDFNPVYDNGQRMYLRSGTTDFVASDCANCMCHNQANYHGMGGGPLFYLNNTEPIVVGVNSNGTNAYSCHTRFTSEWANFMAALVSGVIIDAVPEVPTVDFTIGPNPIMDAAWIDSPEPIVRLTLVDGTGRTVIERSVGADRTQLQTAHLPTGIYTVLVRTERGQGAKKVAIVH